MNTAMWLLLVCVGVAMSDQSASSYGAPADTGYAAPAATGYDAPAATGYAAPATGYETGYETTGYQATGTAVAGDEDIVGKLMELLPLFLAVFAAILLAQLLTPLLGGLLAIIVAILPGALVPKAVLLNVILGVFGVQLCTTALAPFPGGRGFEEAARSFSETASGYGIDLSPDQIDIVLNFVQKGISAATSQFS
jgi:hypothetical protein